MVIIHVISKVYLQDQPENTVQNNPRRSKEASKAKVVCFGLLDFESGLVSYLH